MAMNCTNQTLYCKEHTYDVYHEDSLVLKHADYMVVMYALAYGIIFVLAFVGNILVVTVVARNPSMHTVMHYFLVNLALSDLLVAIVCMPLTLLANIFAGWPWGSFTCKAVPFLQGASVFVSVNTLAAIAVDRYLAICYTWQPMITSRVSRVIIVSIWIFAFCIMTPQAYVYTQYDDYGGPMCNQLWEDYDSQRTYFVIAHFMCCYIVPLVFIMLCYIMIGVRVWRRKAPGIANDRGVIYRSKIKVMRMLTVVVLLFALSWLPLYCVYFRIYFYKHIDADEANLIFDILVPVSQWLGSSNSGMNPIIYCFFSRKYRRAFRSVLGCCYGNRRDQRQTCYTGNTRCVAMENSTVLEGRRSLLRADNKLQPKPCDSSKNITINYNSYGELAVCYRNDKREEDQTSAK